MVEENSLFKVKSTLLPSLNIDYTLLGYKSPARDDLFKYEIDLHARYAERIQQIEALKELQLSKTREVDKLKRKSVGDEFQKVAKETQDRIIERNQKVQNSNENDAKIQQLLELCPGIKDRDEARFYLESQNFNIEAAKGLYTSLTGRSSVARNNTVVIRFCMPTKEEFSSSFDSNSLMWTMLEIIHKKLAMKRNFRVVIKATGREIPIEEMTKKTFANHGLASNTVLNIVYA